MRFPPIKVRVLLVCVLTLSVMTAQQPAGVPELYEEVLNKLFPLSAAPGATLTLRIRVRPSFAAEHELSLSRKYSQHFELVTSTAEHSIWKEVFDSFTKGERSADQISERINVRQNTVCLDSRQVEKTLIQLLGEVRPMVAVEKRANVTFDGTSFDLFYEHIDGPRMRAILPTNADAQRASLLPLIQELERFEKTYAVPCT